MLPLGVEEKVIVRQKLRAVEVAEDGVEGASVPGICHTAAVVTLAGQIAQGFELDLLTTSKTVAC